MKKIIFIISLLGLFLVTAGCAITKSFGPYYGKVIEAETKEPIEGAAVLVVFYTEEYGPAGAITRYADALETLTDKNGEFKFPRHRITLFRPLQGWDRYGYFTIFKPSYGCYPDHKDVKPMFVPNGSLPEDQYVIIELPRLRTREEIERNGSPRIRYEIPYKKQKNYISLINQLNELLGIKFKESEQSFGKE